MDETADLENTGFLLQRLQELKNWQRQQEENLLKEQEFKLAQVVNAQQQAAVTNNEDDDDTTIDQDLSSLNSEIVQSLPSWASRSSSSMGAANQNDECPEEQVIIPPAKSFEELLEEKLKLDKENIPGFATESSKNDEKEMTPNTARDFLRRGTGLARYGGVGGPKSLTPKLKRSASKTSIHSGNKQQSRLKTSTSCPNVAPPATQDRKAQQQRPIMRKTSLKLKPSQDNKKQKKAENMKADHDEVPKKLGNQGGDIYDSVELSFIDKLEKAEKKDSADLRAFELLEEAALDSSFCSTSSTVKKLIENLPSPIPKSHTSTPKVQKTASKVPKPIKDHQDDDNGNADNLMRDIKAFLENKGAVVQDQSCSEDEDEPTVTTEDNGIIMDSSGPQQIVLNGERHKNQWSSDDDDDDQEEENPRKKSASSRKNVHFRDEMMSFSPPRVPKDSPSYLIWSIFTKEREERARKFGKSSSTAAKKRTKSADRSPMSRVSTVEHDFETTLLNAKLAELQKEIDHYQKENAALSSGRRKLHFDRKQLAKEVQEFELFKEIEKKKMEEDKKRIRRDKNLVEKTLRDRKANYDQKAGEEIAELQTKVQKLNEELQRKEAKWVPTIAKLQDQVKFLEKENQLLHEDNHKLKLKTISPKVSTHLVDPASRKITNGNHPVPSETAGTPDSGCHLNNNNSKKNSLEEAPPQVQIESSSKKSDPKMPPAMSFSPAESLDSEMTLVSSSLTTTAKASKAPAAIHPTLTIVQVKKNESKGTTEKIYSDNSVEIVYSNGNRKEISADGKSTKVYYYNSDVKETLESGLVKYFYSQTHTWHLTYPDGKEVIQFNNGQEEIRYPNGTLQISFADGSVKRIDTDGTENINFPDGTKVIVKSNGERTLLLPSGQKEIHATNFKKREYPDGTVKILYDDGRMETRYSSGRVRIKDVDGNLVHDSNSKMNSIKV